MRSDHHHPTQLAGGEAHALGGLATAGGQCAARAGLQVGVQVVLAGQSGAFGGGQTETDTPAVHAQYHPVFRQGLALRQNTQPGGLRVQTVGQIQGRHKVPVQLHLGHARAVAQTFDHAGAGDSKVVHQLIQRRRKALPGR